MNSQIKLSVLLGLALFATTLAFGAERQRPGAQAGEQAYWKKVHDEKAREKADQEKKEGEHREQVIASLPDLVREAAAIQPELLAAEDGFQAAPPPTFSLLQRYSVPVGLGVISLLIVAFARRMLARHKHEGEIRALSGGYLSDGTEVAKYQLPEWFAPPRPVVATEAVQDSAPADRDPHATPSDPLGEFFQHAPRLLANLGNQLEECSAEVESEEGRQQKLGKLHDLISALEAKTNHLNLRAAWQISAALELLVKRVAEKPKDATASVLKTMAAAVELLRDVCVPGIRPTLLTEPPVKILAVDDDPLCRRAIQFALQKAHFTPDLAEDGEHAVAAARNTAYDVVFMDIQMPGMDGFAACSQILETQKNRDVPVIFVTAQSDFKTRAQSSLKGGRDLIAKPYLLFEITVKAVTCAMRKRLQESVASPTDTAETVPSILELSVIAVESDEALVTAPLTTTRTSEANALPGVSGFNPPADLKGDFFTAAPEYIAATRRLFQEWRVAPNRAQLPQGLDQLSVRMHTVASQARLAGLKVLPQVATALDALLKKLGSNSKTVTTSTLNTVSNALQLLEGLCVSGVETRLADHPPVRILVVDDEPLARRAVVGALQLAFEKPESAQDGVAASALAAAKPYDVIFTDVQMPKMDGFELAAQIRASGPNRNTPVVFITNFTDIAAQAQALESGASAFIGKPFLPIEITVKALTFAWGGRLRKIEATSVASPSSKPELASIGVAA